MGQASETGVPTLPLENGPTLASHIQACVERRATASAVTATIATFPFCGRAAYKVFSRLLCRSAAPLAFPRSTGAGRALTTGLRRYSDVPSRTAKDYVCEDVGQHN
jgi:hypothetical protein